MQLLLPHPPHPCYQICSRDHHSHHSAGSVILIHSFHPEDARAPRPQAEREGSGHYLLFLSTGTFSAGCYPRPRAGARAELRWTDHCTGRYIGAAGGGWCGEGFVTKPREPGLCLSCFVGRTAGNGAAESGLLILGR